jgi:hypothetical protein
MLSVLWVVVTVCCINQKSSHAPCAVHVITGRSVFTVWWAGADGPNGIVFKSVIL